MTHQTIEQAVEEFKKQFNAYQTTSSSPYPLLVDWLREALQAQRDAGAEEQDNNSTAIKAIEGYNQEKIELTRMMREVGDKEFYLQTEVKNRMEVIDSKIQALTPPTK